MFAGDGSLSPFLLKHSHTGTSTLALSLTLSLSLTHSIPFSLAHTSTLARHRTRSLYSGCAAACSGSRSRRVPGPVRPAWRRRSQTVGRRCETRMAAGQSRAQALRRLGLRRPGPSPTVTVSHGLLVTVTVRLGWRPRLIISDYEVSPGGRPMRFWSQPGRAGPGRPGRARRSAWQPQGGRATGNPAGRVASDSDSVTYRRLGLWLAGTRTRTRALWDLL